MFSEKGRSGFTLIELLAVILILGVIALIAIPIVSNIIESAKKGAAVSSALGIVDALEKKVALNELSGTGKKFDLPIVEENLRNIVSTYDVQIKNFGMNDSGMISISNDGFVSKAMFLINNYYVCYTPDKQEVNKKGETTDFGECNGMSVPDIITAYQVSYSNPKNPGVNQTIGDSIEYLQKVFGVE